MTNRKGPPKPINRDGKYNCPVCGKPRGTGIRYIDHGACMEKLAADAKKRGQDRTDLATRFSEEDRRKSRYNETSRKLLKGDLTWLPKE